MQPNVLKHQQLQQMVKPFLHFQMLELVIGQYLPELHLFEHWLLVVVAQVVVVFQEVGLVLAAVVCLFGVWLKQSRLGFALRVIGGDEVVASHVGIHSAKAKVLLFSFSGAVAALTGAILAPRLSYIEPSMVFSADLSFQVVIMALLGGVHRLWGPIVGVIPFTFLWEFIAAVAPTQTVLLLGVAFLVIVYFIPQGIAGLIEKWFLKGGRHE